jgi:biopolymer transport protein ExbD
MAAKILSDNDDGVIAEINIVPFVDIVLVLLIIFMLTSSMIAKASITVDLPSAASANESVSSTLNIVMNKDEEIYLNGVIADEKALAEQVSRASWNSKDVQAVISADRSLGYGKVIRVIDIVKGNGIKSFALNIEHEL